MSLIKINLYNLNCIEKDTLRKINVLEKEFENTDWNNRQERKRLARTLGILYRIYRDVRILIYYRKQEILKLNCSG